MSEEITITKEQIEAYQRQQAAQEQASMQQCANDLVALAAERGFVIIAVPQLANDGRIGAVWGVQRKAQ